MKKIYLVKKDVNKPAGEGNWITMTPYEFAQFMKTPEGHERRKCFAQIDACDYDDDIIVAECDEKLAKEIRAEKDGHDYLLSVKNEIGYTIFSYDEQESTEDDLTGEELIEDNEANVEDDAIKTVLLERLKTSLNLLSLQERHLIFHLYLSSKPMTETEYANKFGGKQTSVNYRKMCVLKKLKKLI